MPKEHSSDIIRILPKSLAVYHPNGQCKINSSDNNNEHDSGQTERKHEMYDQSDKTQNFQVAQGFVSFTRTFQYLGSLISYNLRNNDDITARIAAVNASMGALKEVWWNPHLDVYNKYLLFRAIPMNLLLWGAETWLLQKSQLDKLEVFLHRSIRRILQISMTKVQEQWLCNDKVRGVFNFIPCIRKMIAAQQMNFVEKMIKGPPDCPSRNMIIACCDHKRQVGRPQMTGKHFMVENLRLLFHDVPTVQIDQYGSLRTWIHEASNKEYWCLLIGRLLHPLMPLLNQPADWRPLPTWQACHAAAGHPPTEDIPNSNDKTTTEEYKGQPKALPQPAPWTPRHSPAA